MMVTVREKQEELDFDRILLSAGTMADALEYYLAEGNIFRIVMIHSAHGLERMTMSVGELLTLLNILKAMRPTLTAEQKLRLDKILATIEQANKKLSTSIQDMIVREIMSRLDRINWFLHDCENKKEGHHVAFPAEIRNRQRVEELVKALNDPMAESVTQRIARIDQRLRNVTHKSDFIWPVETKIIYPEESYWYLYALAD
jgi:uncharacterized protein YicC (UPF0701 family)